MPNIKSQIKRVKTSGEANMRNSSRMSALKTSLKKARTAIKDNSPEKERICLEAVTALNKAGDHNLLHKNNVSRKVSQLTRALNESKK